MNTQQIKQRLIEAALTETIPETPTFDFPRARRSIRVPKWIGYAAAACVAIAITLPILIHHPDKMDYATSSAMTEDTELELEGAFSMISQHFSTSQTNLIDMVQ